MSDTNIWTLAAIRSFRLAARKNGNHAIFFLHIASILENNHAHDVICASEFSKKIVYLFKTPYLKTYFANEGQVYQPYAHEFWRLYMRSNKNKKETLHSLIQKSNLAEKFMQDVLFFIDRSDVPQF